MTVPPGSTSVQGILARSWSDAQDCGESNASLRGDATMFAKVSAISFGIFFLGFTRSAIACTVSPPDPEHRPKLEHILLTDYPVFIGTVVDSSGPTTRITVGPPPRELTLPTPGNVVKIKVEIPIRGEAGELFEMLNGGRGGCTNDFEVGQRWFFAGTHFGSRYFDGSTLLVDQVGNVRLGSALGVANEEIFKMFPEILKLPSPSIVAQDYLKEK
jgi:hypothetical protein